MALGELFVGIICDKLKTAKRIQNLSYVLLFCSVVSVLIIFKIPVAQMVSADFLYEFSISGKYLFIIMIPVIFFRDIFHY